MLRINRISVLAIMSIFAGTVAGCSDDAPTNPPPATQDTTKNYFPLTAGDYKIRFNTIIKEDTSQNETTIDSAVVSPSQPKEGMQAHAVIHFNMEGQPIDTMYLASSGNAAYRHFAPASLGDISEFRLTDRWVKIADFNVNVSSWITLDTTVEDVPVQLASFSGTATGSIKQTYTKGAVVSVTIGDSVETAQEFTASTAVNMKVTIPGLISDSPVSINNVQRLHFVDGIGLVMRHSDFQNVPLAGGAFQLGIEGFDEYVIRHKTTVK